MKAKDVMSTNPDIISPDVIIKEAAKKMRSEDIGFLPIGENDRLVGAITDRDIVIRAVAEGKDPSKTTVREAMTDEIRYCFENDDIKKVAEMMGNLQIRRIVALNEDKRIVGIVSLGDIARVSSNTDLSGKLISSVSENK